MRRLSASPSDAATQAAGRTATPDGPEPSVRCEAMPSVLMLEFNELSPRLMGQFINEGHLPNFERLRSESVVLTTDPEETPEKLNPWVQWVTLHTGAPRSEHGIEKLGEANRLRLPTIATAVGESGRSSWICGSMNLPHHTVADGSYLPDPWNPDQSTSPADFSDFSLFVRDSVQEHTNDSAKVNRARAGRFLRFLVTHGLRPSSASLAVRQLAGERIGSRGHWARATVLDRFQWDLFRWQLLRSRPGFATFFSNSTAHYQHMYWRNLEPERFSVAPEPRDQARFSGAVLHGYQCMDRLLAEAIELADRTGAVLMMCTALSQQPYLDAEAAGGNFTYRPKDFAALAAALRIGDVIAFEPVMAGQFRIRFPTEAAAVAAGSQLASTVVNGIGGMEVRIQGNEVFTGCAVTDNLPPHSVLIDADGVEHRFHDLFYRFETAKSGYHHPDGMWWIRVGANCEISDSVSLRAVAPTVLSCIGVSAPESMRESPIEIEIR